MTIRSDVDELIGWYAANRPEVRQVRVACRPGTLRKFCKKLRRGPFVYRDFEIVPVRQKKLKPEQLALLEVTA